MENIIRISFLALILIAVPKTTPACVCDIYYDGTAKSMMRHANSVFVGQVLEIRAATQSEREAGSGFGKVRLRVERYWKGVKAGEVVVETEGDCGAFFRVGEKYLVYARGKHLTTGCTRTRSIESAEEDLKALGPGKEF